ncbi:hypothetical protein DPM19_04195 [Actinomadura craniellae]|uniref:Uncharacterized protein n=1 Tax=Actinomadura craniellae TaxID=2231787 RepID=A0A365HAT9_9ACTN|nr:hypothetical protein [Actinomadura craniellae]RAY16132.1 hypothetical protein DPM19_04195 [Actinomadura craniellae]
MTRRRPDRAGERGGGSPPGRRAVIEFGAAPATVPLDYPGRTPDGPAAVLSGRFLYEVCPAAAPVGRWTVGTGGDVPLDEFLARAGGAPIGARYPVLAVGSNASPAQLHRKFARAGVRPLVPITAVRVSGVIAGVSAHVNRAGYVPATPVAVPGEVSDLHLIWPDDAALAVLDATEPNYHRVRLPARHPVRLPGGSPDVPRCWVYASRHGCVVERGSGRPRRLTDQPSLIAALLADLPELAAAVGAAPESFVAAVDDRVFGDRVRRSLAAGGLTRFQPGFTVPAGHSN